MSAGRILILVTVIATSCAGSASSAYDRADVTPIAVQVTSIDVSPASSAGSCSTDAREMHGVAVVSILNRIDEDLTVASIRIQARDRGPFLFRTTTTGFEQRIEPGESVSVRCPLAVRVNREPDTISPNRVALTVTVLLDDSRKFEFNISAPVISLRTG